MQVILVMLDARLADIKNLWTSGKLRSVGIDGRQTIQLIEALFEHNQNRQNVLEAISSS